MNKMVRLKRLLPVVIVMLLTGCDGTSSGESMAVEKKTSGLMDSNLPGKQTGSADSANHSQSTVPGTIEANHYASVSESTSTGDGKISESEQINQLEEKALFGRDPKARISALQTLLEKVSSESAMLVVEQTLNDADKEVRKETLLLIYKKRLPVPDNVLHDVAVGDPSDNVRGMAWLNIADRGGPDLREYLNDALNDSNPDIRRDAQLRLDQLDKQGK